MSKEAVIARCFLCRQRVSVIDGKFIVHATEPLGDVYCAAGNHRATDREIAKGQA